MLPDADSPFCHPLSMPQQSTAKTGYKRSGSVFREPGNEDCGEEARTPRERTAPTGSHCAIKPVIPYMSSATSFTTTKTGLDLDEGHKAEKEQARTYSKGGSSKSFRCPFFRSTVTPAVLTPGCGLSRSR